MSKRVTVGLAVYREFERWLKTTDISPSSEVRKLLLNAWMSGYWQGWDDSRTQP